MYENFHDRRKNKAADADNKNGHYSERAEQNAADYRSQQTRKGAYHIYHSVALHKKLLFRNKRYACLNGGLIDSRNAVQYHQYRYHQRDKRNFSQSEAKYQNHRRCCKIKHYHNIPLVFSVGNNASEKRKNHHRDKGAGSYRSEKRRGIRLPKQIKGQGKAQYCVAEKRDYLTDNNHCKIAFKKLVHICTSELFF